MNWSLQEKKGQRALKKNLRAIKKMAILIDQLHQVNSRNILGHQMA
jgi:hypothetical protein